jgi:hypothetical protein
MQARRRRSASCLAIQGEKKVGRPADRIDAKDQQSS